MSNRPRFRGPRPRRRMRFGARDAAAVFLILVAYGVYAFRLRLATPAVAAVFGVLAIAAVLLVLRARRRAGEPPGPGAPPTGTSGPR